MAIVATSIAALIILLVAFLLWTDPWIYSVNVQRTKEGGAVRTPMRTNKATGERQYLNDGVWQDDHIIHD